MTLLEEFIFALSKTKRAKLRPLQFRGDKRKIFFKILDCRDRQGIDPEPIIKQHKLTKKRYYQMLSEMLAACYRDIAPDRGCELLMFLGNKQLFRHFYNEMKRKEAELIEANDPKELEEYYYRVLMMQSVFQLPAGLKGDAFNELIAYEKRYLAIKAIPDPSDMLFVRMMDIQRKIAKQLTVKLNMDRFNAAVAEAESIVKELEQGGNILSSVIVLPFMITLTTHYFSKRSLDRYVRLVQQLLLKHRDELGILADHLELQIAKFTPISRDRYIEKVKRFLSADSSHCGVSIHYVATLFPEVLASGDYHWLKKYIENDFPYNLDLIQKGSAITYWVLLMRYNIEINEYPEGQRCLEKAVSLNTGRQRDIDFDLFLRSFDAFFVAIEGNASAAEDRVERHLRYALRRGYRQDDNSKIIFMKAIRDLMKNSRDETKARKIYEKAMAELTDRPGNLFKTIYKKYF
jgi:hypothetical protein